MMVPTEFGVSKVTFWGGGGLWACPCASLVPAQGLEPFAGLAQQSPHLKHSGLIALSPGHRWINAAA